MKDYFVEVFCPPYPSKGYKVRVFRKLVRDALSPNLIVLYKINAIDRNDALANVLLGKGRAIIGSAA